MDRRELLQLLSLGAAGATLGTGCCKCPEVVPPGEWRNAVDTLRVRPHTIFRPHSASEIGGIVRLAEEQGRRVRMTGSGHSFSDVALTDDYLLQPDRLNRPLELDRARLAPEHTDDKQLVRVQSGMTIAALNAHLALQTPRLTLQNMGGYDGQTIAGVAMTATHGSGIAYGPIASQIVSMQIITATGKLFQIEPTIGISKRDAYPAPLEEDPRISVELVQNDDWFYSAGVSMGCMGIVYAYILRAVPQFWLRERRKPWRWSELSKSGGYIEKMLNGEPFSGQPQDPEHVEIMVNPYANGGEHKCVVTERYRVAEAPAATSENTKRGRLGDGDFFTDARRRQLAEKVLVDQLDAARGAGLRNIIDGMLWILEDEEYVALSPKVFSIGALNHFRVYGIEMAFPVEQTVAATQRLFAIAREQEMQHRHHSVPVTLRFVNKTNYHLAMQYGRRTMMMEIGALVAAHESEKFLRTYEERFISEFGARPHWGLDLSVLRGDENVARLYPKWTTWKQVHGELNKSGVFAGKLSERLGLVSSDA